MTAAGLWLTAAVGVAVGLGREASAVLGTVLALIILALLPQVRPHADVDERVRKDTGALQHTAVRACDTQEESPGEW
jgi:uncharacterized membrane protein YhiD involved in acid resistance